MAVDTQLKFCLGFVTDPRQEILESGSMPEVSPTVAQDVPANYYDQVPLRWVEASCIWNLN